MKNIKSLLAFCLLACATVFSGVLHAQLAVGAQLPRANYLLYERIDMTVSVENNSDEDILLSNDQVPWIRFLVTDKSGLPITSAGRATFPPLTLKPGETKNVTINLTPLYNIRQLGEYRAAAVVNLPGKGEIISSACGFQILEGRKVWSEKRTLEGSERTYTLMTFSPLPDRTMLYLRVADMDQNIIYANLSLGNIAGGVPPEVHLDGKNNIHVLQCVALSTYLYTRASEQGKVLSSNIFRTQNEIPPRLAVLDGDSVVVQGGMEETAQNSPDRLSDTQNGGHPSAPSDAALPHSTESLPR
jgi:hypothetical protein